ncbi:MAG: gamma-glutamyltransferase [Balneolaceae bacterium]
MISARLPLILVLLLFSSISIFTGCEGAGDQRGVSYTIPEQPEMSTGYTEKPGWQTSEFAVAAANPLATDAGYQVIKSGGSAVDAAIAVQMVLALVEPQSSGIGGGAFLLAWDGSAIHAYDGRETAPAAADENWFLDENGEPLPFGEAVRSGRSVGVPGTLAMLETAHREHGNLPWEDLFRPAITLAEEGFNISPRLHGLLESENTLPDDEIAGELYYDENGIPHPVGYKLRNPALAEILRQVSREGTSAFYTGTVAENIAERVNSHERPGDMSVDDIEGYPVQDFRRTAMCNDWRTYRICGFPPPASGHIAIMQILGIMDELEVPETGLQDSIPSAKWLHQYSEAAKLAYADRARYIGDSLFVEPPADSWQSLLGADYLSERAKLIGDTSMETANAGIPGPLTTLLGLHPQQPESGTSHISIFDPLGNAVSMTTTIESGFGSRIMSDGGTGLTGGFILNNELTDFSLTPVDEDGNLIANRVEPGKRPRSSMSPTLIFEKDSGSLIASVGSPGGGAIIHYTAKTIVGMLDWNLNAQKAINLPNFVNYNGPTILETDRFPAEIIEALEALGHEVLERDLTSGIQTIQRTDTGFYGGADPRREGVVMGD